jgi:diguanylate cyclase (GGDEF)-like protein/PAS domain S-box-containing protein
LSEIAEVRAVTPAVAGGSDRFKARVIDALPDAVIIVDAKGRLVWGNHTAETLFDRSVVDAVGWSSLELVHPDDLELVLRSLVSIQAKEIGAPIELRLKTKSGWRLMELVGSPLPWLEEGAVLLSIRDLTQRRRFELVHDRDARLRSLVHNSAAITMLVSADGCVESVSGAVTRQLGHDPEVIEGLPLAELVPEPDRPLLRQAFERASRGASVAGPETVVVGLIRHGNRETLPFELSIVNLIDDPTVRGYVVTGHDVTERRAADLELRTALSLQKATLDATADGILVVSTDGKVVSFNRSLVEMWQVSDSVLDGADQPSVMAAVREQLLRPEEFVSKVQQIYRHGDLESSDTLEFKDGRVFERVSKPQTVDGAIVGRVWSFRDITDRKRLEERLSYQAFHDSLTGLANRALFQDRLHQAVKRVERTGQHLCVLFLDLDNLKVINDTLGHTAGDDLLRITSDVVRGCLRPFDTVARLGGDEFGVLVEDLADRSEAFVLAERMLAAIRQPMEVAGQTVSTTVSIGITFDAPGHSGDQLLCNADLAMYTAKERGGNGWQEFQDGMLASLLAAH